MPEGYTHEAGGGYTLNIIRHGHDSIVQKAGINATGGAVYPGEALAVSEDGDGNRTFIYHDGSVDAAVYVAIEADGRGMTANPDEDADAYEADEGITAVKLTPTAGLNLRLATGETVGIGDGIGPTGGGVFATGASKIVAEADESRDLSGASDAGLVATEVTH